MNSLGQVNTLAKDFLVGQLKSVLQGFYTALPLMSTVLLLSWIKYKANRKYLKNIKILRIKSA